MATEQNISCVSIPSSGDLSTKQYLGVNINTSGLAAVVASAGGDCVGILQNKPASTSEAATVAISGVSKAVAGGAITAGDKVQVDNGGKFLLAASADHVVGRALTGASGDNIVFNVLLGSRHILA